MIDDVVVGDAVVADAVADAVAVAVAVIVEVEVVAVVALVMFAGIQSASGLDVVVVLASDYLVKYTHLHLIRIHRVFYVVFQEY